MLNISYILASEERCIAHTGINLTAFAYLCLLFWPEYELHMNTLYEKRHGTPRKRALGWWRGGRLKTLEEKLFFILYYLKTYQTYATLWWAFDLDKPKAYIWVKNLLPPLLATLKKTTWYLQPLRKSWKSSWKNIPKWKIASSMEWNEVWPEVTKANNNDTTTPEKRRNIRKKTSPSHLKNSS